MAYLGKPPYNRGTVRIHIPIHLGRSTSVFDKGIKQLIFVAFAILFAARQLVIELIVKEAFLRQFLLSGYNTVIVIAISVIAMFGWLINIGCLSKKNVKALNGGSVEYEFL